MGLHAQNILLFPKTHGCFNFLHTLSLLWSQLFLFSVGAIDGNFISSRGDAACNLEGSREGVVEGDLESLTKGVVEGSREGIF